MNIQIFNFDGNDVRELTDMMGNPWFIAKDVSDILGFRDAYTATRGLDDDEKLLHKLCVEGQSREVTLISESGLYNMILRSYKPEAKAFKKWVTSEVLPSIRKTGSFSIKPDLPDFTDPAESARAWANQFEKRERAERQAEILAIKAAVADRIANSDGLFTLTEMGKIIGTNPRKLMWWLEDEGILYRFGRKSQLLPKEIFRERNYFKVIIDPKDSSESTKVTFRGIEWVCAKFQKAHNLLPFPAAMNEVLA